ncbi:helix-turn-helix domain-containing protein [Microbacterium azadirachtae]|nr:AraC family transcriptional regulator [Microbacterium azadirachtae]
MSTSLVSDESLVHVAAIVEGAADLTMNGRDLRIEAGQMIVLDGGSSLRAASMQPWARYGWFFRKGILRGREYRHLFDEPRTVPRSALLALTSVSNALLQGGGAYVTPSIHTRIAMEHLVAGAVGAPSPRPQADPVHRDGLFLAAQTIISEGYADPAMTVDSLCRDLSVSPSSLHRAYRPMGVTPRKEIERHRVTDAVRRLAVLEEDQDGSIAEIAAQTGFASVITMRRSLVRAGSSLRGR